MKPDHHHDLCCLVVRLPRARTLDEEVRVVEFLVGDPEMIDLRAGEVLGFQVGGLEGLDTGLDTGLGCLFLLLG